MEHTYRMLIEGLFATATNVSFDDEAIIRQTCTLPVSMATRKL